jgi:predicted AlkP superfamily phosphohydrolase/phosphomutase
VDWENTQAYALGLSGIFVNLEGREKHGSVPSDDYNEILENISEGLSKLTDPEEDRQVVSRVQSTRNLYPDGYFEDAPDLLVGYNIGYRVSWDSAIGGISPKIISDNENPWSGDHCFDPNLIPGSLLTNFDFSADREIGLWDVMPGVFDRLGIDDQGRFDGSSEWIRT